MPLDRSAPPDAAVADTHPTPTLAETRAELARMAGSRFGKLPVGPFVELILAHTLDADWPVRKAAMEALIRRVGFAQRDSTRVLSHRGKAVVGLYRVGSTSANGSSTTRSYDTEICSLDPLITSCNCPDFLRASLGLCKHGLVALLSAGSSAFASQKSARRRVLGKPALHWDPVAPLTGPDDRLARLKLMVTDKANQTEKQRFERTQPRFDSSLSVDRRLRWIENTLAAIREGRLSAQPAVVKVLEEEREQAARLLVNARGFKRAEAALSQLRRPLYDYQKQGVRQFLQTGSLLLADDMGLGKTTQAIAACHALYNTGRIERGLLVVPAALRSQWLREWREVTTCTLTEVTGDPEERAQTYRQTKRGLLLIGYELLLRDLPYVQNFAPQLVLLDEAQRIKNWATKSAASVKSLKPMYRLVLTGTPMENRFEELASLMDFVDDRALEPKWRLVPWHSVSASNADRGGGGVRNLNVLRERLGSSFLRRRRVEVLSQLPSRTDTRIGVELTPEQTEEHGYLDRPIATLIQTTQVRPLTQSEFLRLMQLLNTQRMICNGLAQVNFEQQWPLCRAVKQPSERFLQTLYSPKLIAFRNLVEQFVVNQGRKIVVFSQWRNMLRLAHWSVQDILSSAGKRGMFFTGAESRKAREHALIDFHDQPSTSVLFLSDAGGVGLNLQHAASCCVNLELPWNPAVLEQRIARVYRLGQREPVDVINLVSESGIESRIADLLTRKQAVFSNLFDGTSDEVLFDGDRSFLAGVKRLAEPELDAGVLSAEQSDSDAELEQIVTTLSENEESTESPSTQPTPTQLSPTTASEPEGLPNTLAGISIQMTPDGRLRIDAPPELAAPLAKIFESLAASLTALVP